MYSVRETGQRLLKLINENKIVVGLAFIVTMAIPTGIWIFKAKKKTASEYTWYRMSQINNELLAAEQLGEHEKALSETIEAYIDIKTNQAATDATPWLLLRLGNAQCDARKFDNAIETYREFIKKYPQHSAVSLVRLSLGYAYEEKGMMQEALQQFKEIAGEDNLFIKTQRALDMGRCHEKLGSTDMAKKAYNEVIELSPNSDTARLAQYRLENLE
ncbi:MAG TPA: tetratricopeptide repeat protein [Candidatus Brocadiia bacterium]|nr:tetratricopeptide repeat protein [Candidatus Brocadiales bacterium]